MSQYGWTLLDYFGNRYKVGIYHGESSGHVMIHCNKKVIIIDFNVLHTKKYSFFLGHEFCELKVIKDTDSYRYELRIDEDADTALNRLKRKHHRNDMIKAGILAILFFSIVIIVTALLYYNF